MGLDDEISNSVAKLGAPSKWDAVIEALGDDAPRFKEHLAGTQYSSATLWRVLRDRGIQVHKQSVSNWREALRDGRIQ